MKQCTICKKDLPTSLDEYGPVNVPLCQSCNFTDGYAIDKLLRDYFKLYDLPKVTEYCQEYYYGDFEVLWNDLEFDEDVYPELILG